MTRDNTRPTTRDNSDAGPGHGHGGDVAAILFDKDGTLFEFGGTWNAFGAAVIAEFSAGDPRLAQALADAARFDLAACAFLPDSPIIAGTNREAAMCFAQALPGSDIAELELRLLEHATNAPLVEAAPLAALLHDLAARGLVLGVMTNDAEAAAHAHLDAAGVRERFAFVAGFDSGFGAKPDPDPLLAFCDRIGHDPARAVMVGDSTHDLVAGRAAGMQTIGVLTGLAERAVLEPYADVVLTDIGQIPGWLDP